MMNNLTLIIPSKQEAESLPIFLKELDNYDCKKLIVLQEEDYATKACINEFNNLKILVQKNNGYGNALIEGINNVSTEYCCIINADGSMNPKYLPLMLEKCKDQDFVFTSRYQMPGGGSDDDDFVTLLGNKIFSFTGNLFFKLNISDILYTYILGKSSSFEKLHLKKNDFRICVELPIKVKRLGFNYISLPSYERSRIGGKKKVNALKDGFLILIEMIRLFFKKS
jgi:glycosyltransferase involved in cell wall biosynthesis